MNWLEPEPISIDPVFQSAVGGHPLVAQTLWRRGLRDWPTAQAFLDPSHYLPADPYQLPGLEQAANRIETAIRRGETLAVWGDFDVDGQTSTAVLVSTLQKLGAKVLYHIPVRAEESHGVNLPNLQPLVEQGIRVLLTCDTGISANEAVAYAQNKGVDVLVTDHHDLPAELPPAFSITNPKLLPRGHPLGTLPGVGVAYKLAEALFARAGRPAESADLLDLVALGIVADLALQTGDARFLVQRGLEVLRKAGRPGLRAIMDAADLTPANLTEEHIGFFLGPRLNALGRLDDANPAVELLTTGDVARSRLLAAHLEGLNARRKLLTDQVLQGALAQLDRDPALLDEPALVLAFPTWPAGVIGIVASELVERYNRPVILLASPPGDLARGSARSVEGINVTTAIASQAGLISGFGGHPMAAGLSLTPENLPRFKRGFLRAVQEQFDKTPIARTLPVAGYLSLPELTLLLVDDLDRLAPFGPGNPALALAAREISVRSSITVGRGDEHRQVVVTDPNGYTQKVIWWGGAAWPLPVGRFDLALTIHASNYRGQREVSVAWVDSRPLGEASLFVSSSPTREIIDYRLQPHPLPQLRQLQSVEPLQIWCEGEARDRLEGQDRNELIPAPALVIWTTPPGPAELRAALERANPQKVILFAVDPGAEALEAFLRRLAGLAKYALGNTSGRASLAKLAAAAAQRESTIRKGLAWLAARGLFKILYEKDGQVLFELAHAAPSAETELLEVQLQALLDETAAYRAFFRKAGPNTLI